MPNAADYDRPVQGNKSTQALGKQKKVQTSRMVERGEIQFNSGAIHGIEALQ